MRLLNRLLLVLFLLLLPGTAQKRGGFSLTTRQSFVTGESVSIELSAQNVDQLEFRLYRVKDPVKFFRQLPDPRGFGGAAPPVPRSRTFLERLRFWKQSVRFDMRRLVKKQFGMEEGARLRAWMKRPLAPPAAQVQTFAEVPLLNPQQLIRRWTVRVAKLQPWESQTVQVETPGDGLYIVEATDLDLRAATVVNVSPIAIIAKIAPGQIAAQLVNAKTGEPMSGDLELVGSGTQQTDAGGKAVFPVGAQDADGQVLLLARSGAAFTVAQLGLWSARSDRRDFTTAYVYTDRPIYRPGHKVGMKAIVRRETATGWELPRVRDIDWRVQDSEGNTVLQRSLPVSPFGTVSGEWEIPASAPLGYYSVSLNSGESAGYGSFQVEEYKKPEYEVKVKPATPRVLQGQALEFSIDAQYFFGEPVAGAKFQYTLESGRHWPVDVEEPESEDEMEEGGYGLAEEASGSGQLDASGRATLRFPAATADHDRFHQLEVRVTDSARREIKGRGYALSTVGSFFLRARPQKWVYAPGEEMTLVVEARDYDGRPVTGAPVRVTGLPAAISGVTGAEGRVSLTATAPAPGPHTLAVESGKVKSQVYVWVSGSYRDVSSPSADIQLIPDKKSYRPGETARILVVAGSEDVHVMLTVEGRALHRTDTRLAKGGTLMFDVPIEAAFLPNVFVTAAAMQDGKYRFGSKSVSVPAADKVLSVDVQASKPQFKPGAPASYVIEARDKDGRPVQAEFSLGVVDEAIYALAPDTQQRIDRAFYGRIYDHVTTETSLSFYFSGYAGQRPFPIARNLQTSSSSLAQVKPSAHDVRVRKDFRDTALWLASIVTGPDGRARADLQFPDSITAWRATARGVTADTRVGAAARRVITRKDLILRLAAPRFVTEGDEVVVSAIVNNYLPNDAPVKVELEARGFEELDGKTREAIARAGAETPFDFRLRARRGETAVLTARAISAADSDALEVQVPIHPFGLKIVEPESGLLTDSGKAAVSVQNARMIEVRTMPSLAGAVFGALNYLSTFPYGCTEQTLSSFLPNLLVEEALQKLKLPAALKPRQLNERIEAGMERLLDYQHADGGWGWWKADESQTYMTAHVLAGIRAMEQNNRTWMPESKERARAWLLRAFQRELNAHPDLRAFMAFAAQDQGAVDAVWSGRDRLSAWGLALLGLSVPEARSGEIAARLERMAVVTGEEAYWRADRDPLMDIEEDSSAEATAHALKFLTTARPASPLLPKAARWLVTHRSGGHYWSSTKQTATVVYALTGYLEASGELSPQLSASVRLNGESIYNKELTQADALALVPAGLRIVPKQASNQLEIASSGTGRLYWSVNATRYEQRGATGSDNLRIRRDFFRKENGRLTPVTGPLATGDVLVSRLTVEGKDVRYLLIEDPIPAGAELTGDEDRWWTRRERRDDRAAIFETYFDKKREYLSEMKLTRPGRYQVSPARVAPMYQTGLSASSEAAVIEVKP
jgi:uncharacterized protein YfaS (alpha-2-macroglobulin family)